MCSCAAPAHLISADVSLLMARAGREEGRRGFTVMSSGRCWTMVETKERFETSHFKKKSLSPFNSA